MERNVRLILVFMPLPRQRRGSPGAVASTRQGSVGVVCSNWEKMPGVFSGGTVAKAVIVVLAVVVAVAVVAAVSVVAIVAVEGNR